MPILVLNNWQGMLGNTLLQTYNCILIAIDKKYNIRLPDTKDNHKFSNYSNYYNKRDIILYPETSKEEIKNRYNFYYQKWLPEYEECFNKNHEKAIEILKSLLVFKEEDAKYSGDDTLIIHMRSGDIFTNCPHPKYIPPPLEFYIKIINKKEYKNYIICTQNGRNPCLKPLEKMENVKWSGGQLLKDIKLIMGAKHLVFGVGSFVPSLLMLSKKIQKIYVPSNYGIPGILEGENCLFNKKLDIESYDYTDYLLKIGSKGVRTKYAREVMLLWPNCNHLEEPKKPLKQDDKPKDKSKDKSKDKPKDKSKDKPKDKLDNKPVHKPKPKPEYMCYKDITDEELKTLKIKKLIIKSGNYLDCITFIYENNKKRLYGENGGKDTNEIVLDDNEIITSIQQIYSKEYLGIGLVVNTSKRNKLEFKGRKNYGPGDLKEVFSENNKEIIGIKLEGNEIVGIETR